MKSICFSFSFLLLSLLNSSTTQAQAQADGTVGSVGSHEVTYSELVNSYSKGNNSQILLSDLKNYLPLYLDYKAKLMFARDNGYFADSTILSEHNMYSKQAAYAHWLNNEIKPTLFEQFFERAQVEMKSFHVLISVPQNATKEQEQEIINKLKEAKKEIKAGVDLQEVDKKYSTFRGNRSMGGDLPWVSAGMLVKEFEDQLFNLEVGDVSEPFKTQFGYHIILLQDIRDRQPAKEVSHIFVRPSNDSTALNKINFAYEALEDGDNWDEVVKKYTDDSPSAGNGGKIGWISIKSNYSLNFIEQVRKLDADQPYSEPIRSDYGYHIFKVDSVQNIEDEAAWKKELMKDFENGPYFQENNAFAVDYLVQNYGSAANLSTLEKYEQFLAGHDSSAISTLKLGRKLRSDKLLSFNGKSYTLNDFHAYLSAHNANLPASAFNPNYVDEFTQHIVDKQIIDFTLNKYPEFGEEVESYLNGLVVYKLNDDFIWSGETVDSTRLRNMYEEQIEQFSYPERPFFYMLSARHDSLLAHAVEFIQAGNSPDSVWNEMKRVSVSSDSINTYSEEPFLRLQDMEPNTFSETFEYNKRRGIFYLKDRLPARRMTFEESFNRLLTEFQPTREKEWMNEVRKRYKVKSDADKLTKLYQANN